MPGSNRCRLKPGSKMNSILIFVIIMKSFSVNRERRTGGRGRIGDARRCPDSAQCLFRKRTQADEGARSALATGWVEIDNPPGAAKGQGPASLLTDAGPRCEGGLGKDDATRRAVFAVHGVAGVAARLALRGEHLVGLALVRDFGGVGQ